MPSPEIEDGDRNVTSGGACGEPEHRVRAPGCLERARLDQLVPRARMSARRMFEDTP